MPFVHNLQVFRSHIFVVGKLWQFGNLYLVNAARSMLFCAA